MDRYNSSNMANYKWTMSNPTVIDYCHQPVSNQISQPNPAISRWQTNDINQPLTPHKHSDSRWRTDEVKQHSTQFTEYNSRWQTEEINQPMTQSTLKSSFGLSRPAPSNQSSSAVKQQLYNPFVEDDMDISESNQSSSAVKQQLYNPCVEDDMDISDDVKLQQMTKNSSVFKDTNTSSVMSSSFSTAQPSTKLEIKSGAAFYKGLILYIPCFEQIVSSDKNTSAIKMLFASFEFSFKIPMRIEIQKKPDSINATEASVIFQDQTIVRGSTSTQAAHNEISLMALELLSETCYTIQTKRDYLQKCKLIDAVEMKTLNIMKWEALSQKYPQLLEVTKDSHIQKTLAVFLDSHTSTGIFKDVVCCNLTRDDVRNIKSVIDFFHLTMLPCCVSTNLGPTQGPCIVSIHKYTSAKKLLEVLIESGGENDNFILHPPDTFKDFFKLHQSYWDPSFKRSDKNKILQLKTVLGDAETQSGILKLYENIIPELFGKHKMLTMSKKQNDYSQTRQAGDDFMKETLKIDMAGSKNVAPVERMQLLLKYMEQLQEYGSRVLTSGRQECIKIYHHAIDNLRKDLDTCRLDLEKEQKNRTVEKEGKKYESHQSGSSTLAYKTTQKRSVSPRGRLRSISPKRKIRSKSPKSRSTRHSPPRRPRSPSKRYSPRRHSRPPRPRSPLIPKHRDNKFIESVFKQQFERFVDVLRRNHIEIENTPIERRSSLREKVIKFTEQLQKFHREALDNRKELGGYLDEIEICREDIAKQAKLIAEKPTSSGIYRSVTTPHQWTSANRFQEPPTQHMSNPFEGAPYPPTETPRRMQFFS